jgi:hypothetical protein
MALQSSLMRQVPERLGGCNSYLYHCQHESNVVNMLLVPLGTDVKACSRPWRECRSLSVLCLPSHDTRPMRDEAFACA